MIFLCVRLSQGTYEPGKRHWLKVKKDYLNEGAMADTADLVVLGAFFGKGSNGLLNPPEPLQCFHFLILVICHLSLRARSVFSPFKGCEL